MPSSASDPIENRAKGGAARAIGGPAAAAENKQPSHSYQAPKKDLPWIIDLPFYHRRPQNVSVRLGA